jgi:diguanylate cyclase (GGDEF)-like protein
VQFLGEFSDSFNRMVEELQNVHSAMRKKEEELTELSERLKEEVDERNKAFNALRQREAEFRYLAEHDPLTNTLNRRSFFQLAEVEFKRCRLNNKFCGVALLDLDFFKTFNDSYGHIEGDKALRHVADVGKSGLRHKDIMARIGGEEFIFLFPAADLQQTKIVAERIRVAIAENPVILESGEPVQITASIGVVAVPPQTPVKDNMLASQVIRAADHGLYTSKKYGRNQVTPVDFAGFLALFPEAGTEEGAAPAGEAEGGR